MSFQIDFIDKSIVHKHSLVLFFFSDVNRDDLFQKTPPYHHAISCGETGQRQLIEKGGAAKASSVRPSSRWIRPSLQYRPESYRARGQLARCVREG